MSTELAWAAGFFDGEGCTFMAHSTVRPKDKRYRNNPVYKINTPTLAICQVDRRPLDRFVAAIGEGKVSGPYRAKTANSKPYHRVQVEGRDRVCRILTKLWPYLSAPKREQARAAWALERERRGPKSPAMPALPEDPQ